MLLQSEEQLEYLCKWPESSRFKSAVEERKQGVSFTMPVLKTDKLLQVPASEEAQLWEVRFQLLMSLKMYSQLIDELIPFDELDAPDLFYQYREEYGHRTGSIVSFQTRLIHAEVLRFTPFPYKAVERITRLESNVKKAALLEAMLRMVILVGDETAANKLFEDANKSSSPFLIKALRSIFLGDFVSTQEYLQRLLQPGINDDSVLNSLAICMLYTGYAVDAVEFYIKQVQVCIVRPKQFVAGTSFLFMHIPNNFSLRSVSRAEVNCNL
ncbi:hypothetical protein DICVIV_10587 [Dictyocaulus viviparus]|uniref:Tetratricopeptide repeat protein n=1 Tax=Dictyocaulus viviparus TaxID=29172 RepID=A0A0D8XFH3_DICVI|nr:hypothetical protein DICVIV_10587 [Dictyocaulus viviparus]